MTRTELEINQQDMWRILVFEQRTTLTLAVEHGGLDHSSSGSPMFGYLVRLILQSRVHPKT
jgi:hypothetical protein